MDVKLCRNAILALTLLGLSLPAQAQEEARQPTCRIVEEDLAATIRSAIVGPTLGVSLGDYLTCVQRCQELFESGDALTECIKGCSKIESEVRVLLR